MSSTTGNSSKYTENWITVKNIVNGMIELDNREKVERNKDYYEYSKVI